MGALAPFLMALAGPLARQVLLSLGIGLITFVGVDTAVTSALAAAKGYMGQITADYAAILARAGLFTAMSIIAGGISARVSMMILKRMGRVA
ncbi:Protein of unknown function [Ralstonia sp. 25mfcol4.1]|uniref:DUF2523 family protein n=1 Tax=Ralstonia sp. 25mfcol4.1 TaxID=1761899 RepID=UPI0008881887|nr:DUF2523 family protein [Ralstonia sp. 25mfcol4.1]SDP38556.1 Protein of unknown function [Ralstonia sp. 25mfcol4.1]